MNRSGPAASASPIMSLCPVIVRLGAWPGDRYPDRKPDGKAKTKPGEDSACQTDPEP